MTRVRRVAILGSVFSATLIVASAPAWGDLSETDQGAIATAVASGLASSASSGPVGTATALSTLTTTDIGQYGGANAEAVVALIIADALADGDSAQGVGLAMGQAALVIGAPAANGIAIAVGLSGNPELHEAFDVAVAGSPAGAELIAEADDAAGHKREQSMIGSVTVGGGDVFGAGPEFGPGLALCFDISCD